LLQRLIVTLDPQSREERERNALKETVGVASTFDQIVDEALDLAIKAVDLIEERAGVDEADAYRAFVIHIITQVAQSEREGGLFGVGGQSVSPAERDVIRELTLALRYRAAGRAGGRRQESGVRSQESGALAHCNARRVRRLRSTDLTAAMYLRGQRG
ncbi:hypothetical protein HC891_26255, partial [Candidatus Gracilibacteria bacterium]|nr:hypothetical protein [Candidatus Gracilibacteria bacterium]